MARDADVGEDDMTLLADLAIEAIDHDLERGWTREEVSELPELRDPDLLRPFKRAWISPYSVTIQDTRSRKILGMPVSNGEISRRYLKRTMAEGLEAGGSTFLAKRVPWRRDALQFLDRQPAYYFAGQCGGPFELVDITACYASLYTRLTLDMIYRPETDPPLLGLGRAVFPRSNEWLISKAPRNALWGSMLQHRIREWRHGEPVDEVVPNKFFAPDLRGVVLDAVHAIATTAREQFGALSWAADGGAFRPGMGSEFAHWLSETWALEATIRAEGPGWLFGATSYSIGPEVTEDVKKGHAFQWPETDTLRPQADYQRAWLANVFAERAA